MISSVTLNSLNFVDQPPAVAFTTFADAWPRAIETEIGAALWAIERRKDFDFDYSQKSFENASFCINTPHKNKELLLNND